MFSSSKVLSYLAGLQSWVSTVLLILLFSTHTTILAISSASENPNTKLSSADRASILQ